MDFVATKLPSSKLGQKICLSVEKSSLVDGSIIRVASETNFDKFDLRFGTQSSNQVTGVSVGVGVRLGVLNIHYGFKLDPSI